MWCSLILTIWLGATKSAQSTSLFSNFAVPETLPVILLCLPHLCQEMHSVAACSPILCAWWLFHIWFLSAERQLLLQAAHRQVGWGEPFLNLRTRGKDKRDLNFKFWARVGTHFFSKWEKERMVERNTTSDFFPTACKVSYSRRNHFKIHSSSMSLEVKTVDIFPKEGFILGCLSQQLQLRLCMSDACSWESLPLKSVTLRCKCH